MRPVASKFPISQGFGSGATAGVDPYGTHPMAALVRLYGDYQPYGHAGMDIACPVSTPVYAMSSGTVLWADWGTNLPGDDSGAGWAARWYLYKGFPGIVTVIQHPWGIGVYAHLSSNDAAPAGTKVREGQLIGYSGDTGGVAPHLHVEALINLSYVTAGGLIYGRTDPAPFFGTLTPQSTTTAPIKEDTLSAAEVQEIKDHMNSLVYGGATWQGKDKAPLYDIAVQTQIRTDAIPRKVWATTITRAGKKIPALQELANIFTKAANAEPAIAQILENTSAEDVALSIPDDMAQQVIDALAARLNGAK